MFPVFYSFRRCPYAIRARYILALLDTRVCLREVVLKAKPQALLNLGGRSSVPQLVDLDGIRYPESLDIIHWSLRASKDQGRVKGLWPDCLIQRHKMLAWINYNDGIFKYWLDHYKYADRFTEFDEGYYRQKGEIFLQRLDKRLSRHSFIFGDQVSLADIAIFPFIRQFSAVHPTWFASSGYSYLQAWLNGFLDSDLFKKVVMVKYSAWDEGQEDVIFP